MQENTYRDPPKVLRMFQYTEVSIFKTIVREDSNIIDHYRYDGNEEH